MSKERAKAVQLIELLSDKKINIILDFVQYLKKKEEWEPTNELINSKTIPI